MINRVAVVTGSNKGIGFFIALQLASSGLFSHIILGCRDATRGQNAVNEIQRQLPEPFKTKTNVSFLSVTLGDIDSHERFKCEVEGLHGKLDVLVNNAAMAFKGG